MDTFAKEDWIYKDYENESEGRVDCARLGGTMLKAYLYDDEGKCIEQAGTY